MPETPKKIDELYAYIATEPDGGEGVIAAAFGMKEGLQWLPLVGADVERMAMLWPLAVEATKEKGVPFRVVKATGLVDVTAEIRAQAAKESA